MKFKIDYEYGRQILDDAHSDNLKNGWIKVWRWHKVAKTKLFWWNTSARSAKGAREGLRYLAAEDRVGGCKGPCPLSLVQKLLILVFYRHGS